MIKAIIFDFFGVLEDGGKLNIELLSFIKRTLEPGYKLGIISNSSGGWLGNILPNENAELFDQIVLSGKIGLAKPQTEIFTHATGALGVKPSECLFVDDSLMHCEGARAAGMQSILYQDFDQFKKDLGQLLAAGANN